MVSAQCAHLGIYTVDDQRSASLFRCHADPASSQECISGASEVAFVVGFSSTSIGVRIGSACPSSFEHLSYTFYH
jgi:hypothetical protein